jgi:hypothetical protein
MKSLASVGVNYWLPSYVSGNYYFCNGASSSATSAVLGNSTVRTAIWVVTAPLSITRILAEFTVAGEANSVFRIGIWADNGAGAPSALILDAGTISTGSGNAGGVATGGTPGVYEITVAATLQPGIYHVGGAVQGAPTTQPTMRTLNVGSFQDHIPLGTSKPNAGSNFNGYAQGSVAGAFGSYTPAGANTSSVVRIGFRVA